VAANHVLAHENVLDVLGHVSVRDPSNPDQSLLSQACSPANVTFDGIQRFTLDFQPIDPTALPSSPGPKALEYALRDHLVVVRKPT
jgi:hypothetical protein